MDEKLYRPEPIPRRPSRTPMNGSRPDAHEAIARILADERFQRTMRSTSKRPPIPPDLADASRRLKDSLDRIGTAIDNARRDSSSVDGTAAGADGTAAASKTRAREDLFSPAARQPAFDLPERYREMRAISRWQEGAGGHPGRWLTEAELFWRQGSFMADWEDDCPYDGLFKSYFPTYNAMSDRQLRGYFTWRTAVRKGDIQETSLSFAYVYLYELINGIGVADALDGFHKIEGFWRAYRAFAPELDRYTSVWLQDYAVYHGLDPELLASCKTVAFDRALIALRRADRGMADTSAYTAAPSPAEAPNPSARRHQPAPKRDAGKRRRGGESAIPLPPDAQREERLFCAIDALSTYRLSGSRLLKEQPDALRHVSCAVYMRMSEHHRKQRKKSLMESWFGEQVALPYTMFGSAVFFEPERHADAEYELDEIHRYRCERGFWTCERFHGSRSRSPKLGAAMRAVDRSLRAILDPEHPLKDDGKTPKYLQKFVDREVEAWSAWSAAHAPVHIDIDLSRLAGIRSAAAETREALLIDEERDDDGARTEEKTETNTPSESTPEQRLPFDSKREINETVFHAESQPLPKDPEGTVSPLSPKQATYLQALLDGDRPQEIGTSQDLLVDAINEALFEQIGDTVIEYGPDGPQIIEDYRDDVEGILNRE